MEKYEMKDIIFFFPKKGKINHLLDIKRKKQSSYESIACFIPYSFFVNSLKRIFDCFSSKLL